MREILVTLGLTMILVACVNPNGEPVSIYCDTEKVYEGTGTVWPKDNGVIKIVGAKGSSTYIDVASCKMLRVLVGEVGGKAPELTQSIPTTPTTSQSKPSDWK